MLFSYALAHIVTKTETQETAAALARSNIWRDVCCYTPRCDLVSAPGFCASGPCVHGACFDGFFRAFCLCSAGFQGPACDGKYAAAQLNFTFKSRKSQRD